MSVFGSRSSGRSAAAGSFVSWPSTTSSARTPGCPVWRGCPLSAGDAIHPEHPVVTPEMAPGSEIRAVGADDDVLRLDISLGLDAADIDVVDMQHVVVANCPPDGLGHLGIRIGRRDDEQPHFLGVRSRLPKGPFRHRGGDLLQGGAGVTLEEHVLGSAQRHGHGRRLARCEVQRRQAHRAVERVAPAAPLLRRKRDAGLAERAQITLDGPHADLEVRGQLPCRAAPPAHRPQLFNERVHPVGAVHGPKRRHGQRQRCEA